MKVHKELPDHMIISLQEKVIDTGEWVGRVQCNCGWVCRNVADSMGELARVHRSAYSLHEKMTAPKRMSLSS